MFYRFVFYYYKHIRYNSRNFLKELFKKSNAYHCSSNLSKTRLQEWKLSMVVKKEHVGKHSYTSLRFFHSTCQWAWHGVTFQSSGKKVSPTMWTLYPFNRISFSLISNSILGCISLYANIEWGRHFIWYSSSLQTPFKTVSSIFQTNVSRDMQINIDIREDIFPFCCVHLHIITVYVTYWRGGNLR